ncbi:MAG: NAD(P)H-quinone oxidoreductase [Gemmatimonadota bacterium]|jgi:NADPH2:quinone reductase
MKAVVIRAPGGPDVLELAEVPEREPAPGEVRVVVKASAVNRADLMQRRGAYPAPTGWPQDVPGLEYAGVVESLGAGVESLAVGDRVMGLVGGGGYAEYVVVHEREALRVPDRLSFEEAAAVPEAFITAHDALFTRLGLASGEWLLIHAVGSGVGTAALQLARAASARVVGTSRSEWKLERATSQYGLDVPVDASDGFAEAVRNATAGGVDAILDLVGGAYLADNLRVLRTLGRQVVVGLTSGRSAELDMGLLLSMRLTLVGTALRSRPLEEKIAATRLFARQALPLLADGRVRPVVHETLPMGRAGDAHQLLEHNRTFGKVVLAW